MNKYGITFRWWKKRCDKKKQWHYHPFRCGLSDTKKLCNEKNCPELKPLPKVEKMLNRKKEG